MLSRKIEDYLEAILNISEEKGYARTKDIAQELKISSPSVTEMLRKLNGMKFITYRKYEGARLTSKGREIATIVRERHEVMRKFLDIIQVPENIAEKDACTIEHHLDPKTITQIRKLVDFVLDSPADPQWLEHFRKYCETGRHQSRKSEKRQKRS